MNIAAYATGSTIVRVAANASTYKPMNQKDVVSGIDSTDTVSISKTANTAAQIGAHLDAMSSASDAYANYRSSGVTGGNRFTHMTPVELRTAAKELLEQGKITKDDYWSMGLIGVPLGKSDGHGGAISLSPEEISRYENTPMNFTKYIGDVVEYLHQAAGTGGMSVNLESWNRILNAIS